MQTPYLASTDFEVLNAVLEWQIQGHVAALATVVHTYGSSPRPVGSLAGIRADGAVIGSVSGGCIEQDLIARVRKIIPTAPQQLLYGGTAVDSQRWGLPCAGKMKIILERAPHNNLLRQILAALQKHQPIARSLDLANGESMLFTPSATTHTHCNAFTMITSHRSQLRLLIIGAVQTARLLAEMALTLDYTVLICDPREEYRSTWNVPGSTLLDGMPDDVVTFMQPNARSAIVALTHDPKLDDMALQEALRSPFFYVGVLGSIRNQQKRRERLAMLGLASHEIARLRSPVGLPIGSHTPPEIAVAILADLIAVRNNIKLVAKHETHAQLLSNSCEFVGFH